MSCFKCHKLGHLRKFCENNCAYCDQKACKGGCRRKSRTGDFDKSLEAGRSAAMGEPAPVTAAEAERGAKRKAKANEETKARNAELLEKRRARLEKKRLAEMEQ